MTHYFDIPFANSGDKTPIPEAAQPGGQVSYTEGYTVDYELDQATNPAAKDVPRQEHNQLSFVTTELLKQIQESGVLPYRADVNYLLFAYIIGTDGKLHRANIVNGPANAATGSILSFSDNGAGGTTVTATAALPGSIIDGIDIAISGTTNYNGTFTIFNTASPTFDIPVAFVGDDATGTWDFDGVVDPVGDTSGTWADAIASGGIAPGVPVVSVSADDLTLGNLEDKLVAGTNITLTTLNPAGNESIQINSLANPIDVQTIDSSADWIKPSTGTVVLVRQWGAGASGGRANLGQGGGGGGGGAQSGDVWFFKADLGATESVIIGSGGASVNTDNTNGFSGGNTSFGSLLTTYGGGAGSGNGDDGGGGGGGGLQSAGANAIIEQGGDGGDPLGGNNGDPGEDSTYGGGGGGGTTDGGDGGNSVYGGGGGGGGNNNGLGGDGGGSVHGGGGGGGAENTSPGAGGISVAGGNGGAASLGAAAATDGSFPGGGGGGSEAGATGAGANGRCIVMTF